MNAAGSGRSKVIPYPIGDIQGISPGRNWVMAVFTPPDGGSLGPRAIPVDGGSPQLICASYCLPKWSSNGAFLFVPVNGATLTTPGRSLSVPVGPGEKLPAFPPGGI